MVDHIPFEILGDLSTAHHGFAGMIFVLRFLATG
jgi:hypothetical protein